MKLTTKMLLQKILAVVLGLVILFSVVYIILAAASYTKDKSIDYGVTFSQSFAKHLGLDWQAAYLAMLDDLQIKYIRLPSYWNVIEPQQNQYDFNDLDWMLEEADKRDVKVVLVVGRRQPRWPECHDPAWVEKLSIKEQRAEILEMINTVVTRYKMHQAVEIWQVENEPFLDFFGKCPKISKKQLQEEIDLVKGIDSRPILITDSGELSTWYPAIKMGDYFGTTLYRTTYNKLIGYWKYIFVPPSFYRIKAYSWQKPQEEMFVAELQAEPWFPQGPLQTPVEEHYHSMNAKQLLDNAQYVKKTNFSRAYLWGVEWWYWLKEKHNDTSLWDTAKTIFKPTEKE